MRRTDRDFRDRILILREIKPETPLAEVAAVAKRDGWQLRTDRKGGIAAVPAACHPTIQRIRAAMIGRA